MLKWEGQYMQNSYKHKFPWILLGHVSLMHFQVETAILYAQQLGHTNFKEYPIEVLSP